VESFAVFGATGSIGQSTLDLIAQHPNRFRAVVLSAHNNAEKMVGLCQRFRPAQVVMVDRHSAATLRSRLAAFDWGRAIEVLEGEAALEQTAASPEVDTVVAGIVGAAGLGAALAAAGAGKKILLANKEALVMAGALMVAAAQRAHAVVLPVDSEHNAIFQCLGQNYRCFEPPKGVTRLLLTASGGPFRTWQKEAIDRASVAQAIAHPNWSMGRKISVDSATMMNKGLELIEAHWLFALPESRIEVVVHPQSVVHSMVEFEDGSTLAQLGSPDMRTPIACAMSWPQRIESSVQKLDWSAARTLEFEPPDNSKFPSIALARQALQEGGAASAVLNAANEIAVAAFLEARLAFGDIFKVVEQTLSAMSANARQVPQSLQELLGVDHEARQKAREIMERCAT
jgi:1-deoxy-D-xylulose-5-phosphate reductoisomerase